MHLLNQIWFLLMVLLLVFWYVSLFRTLLKRFLYSFFLHTMTHQFHLVDFSRFYLSSGRFGLEVFQLGSFGGCNYVASGCSEFPYAVNLNWCTSEHKYASRLKHMGMQQLVHGMKILFGLFIFGLNLHMDVGMKCGVSNH